jgi:hypothetical protein
VDLKLAAPLRDLAPVDVRLKANYPIPEIWLAPDSDQDARASAEALRTAGFRVVTVPGTALACIPGRNPVDSFALEDDHLLIREREDCEVGYHVPLIGVLFTPRPGDGKLPAPAFLDLYAVCDGRLKRWTFLQGSTGFGGINRHSASFGTNVRALAEDLGGRASRFTLDQRLVNMQVRRRVGAPPPGVVRRGYSFATASLHALLESLEPGLSEIEHDDLASRLAFLTDAASG